jgi:vacuolar-type H+-ATPase subunit H
VGQLLIRMTTDTIKAILDAEKKAESIIQKAEKDKEKRIARARQKAITQLTAEKKVKEQEVDKEIANHMRKIEQQKKHIHNKHFALTAALAEKAEKNISKAVEIVVQKIQEGAQ